MAGAAGRIAADAVRSGVRLQRKGRRRHRSGGGRHAHDRCRVDRGDSADRRRQHCCLVGGGADRHRRDDRGHGWSSAETTAEEPTSAAAEKTVPQGGRLKGLMESDINTWDGTDYYAYAWQVNAVTCNTLVGYPNTTDAVANLTLRPEIAADMPEVSEDGLTYTFTIRSGVQVQRRARGDPGGRQADVQPDAGPEGGLPGLRHHVLRRIAGVPEYKDGKADDITGIMVDGDTVTFTLTERTAASERGRARLRLHRAGRRAAPEDEPAAPDDRPVHGHGAHAGQVAEDRPQPGVGEQPRRGRAQDPDTNNVDGWDVTIGVPPDAQVLQIKNGQADFSFDQTCCIGAAANELNNDATTRTSSSPSRASASRTPR